MCSGASGNSFIRGIRGLGAGRESPRPTPGPARYSPDRRGFASDVLPLSRRKPLTRICRTH
ncbi:hypothetical protein N658DRAFT_500604 [Parathielavia hyrcaniae]|uniref:Uncharacterized protein n=1 Tax=Parathielavia hyrcaniae TaxID=113614 RepID=A0AAN6PT56_9PEZI|nr:hypothetical protein N658DRAFT_500604 [Parathielavia hyrcaniae]